MRDFIDFVKDIIKDRDEEIYEQDVRDEEVYRHRDGCDPSACHALGVSDTGPTGRIDIVREHLTVQHEVRLVEYLRTTVWEIKPQIIKTQKIIEIKMANDKIFVVM